MISWNNALLLLLLLQSVGYQGNLVVARPRMGSTRTYSPPTTAPSSNSSSPSLAFPLSPTPSTLPSSAPSYSLPALHLANLTFLAFGDWGLPGENQSAVAGLMASYASAFGANFVVSLGDNFYEDGVSSDIDPLWYEAYTSVYDAASLQIPWYTVLGNHDYHLNPEAQIDYYKNRRDDRWVMPSHLYSQTWQIPGSSEYLEIVFVDTDILYPEGTPQTASGGIHEVSDQTVDAAYQELENLLSNSVARWLIVAGHYTAGGHGDYDYLIRRLVPLLKDYQVTFYMCGHDHAQYHIQWEGVHYIVSGAGGAQIQQQIDPQVVSGALEGLQFIAFEYGFMTASVTPDALSIQMVDLTGSPMYSFTFSDPRDTSFSGAMSNLLLPGIATVVLICFFAFCCMYRCRSAVNKVEAPTASWGESIYERTGIVMNNTRGVFEILSDSDDDENHLVEFGDEGEVEVEYKFV